MKTIIIMTVCLLFLLPNVNKDDQATKNSLQTIDIAGNMDNLKQVNLSQFTNDIKYIPFETREDAPLRLTYNFDISDNYIVTTDGNSCLLYDLSGHFIRKFGTKGRGPEEYQFITNLNIIKDKKVFFMSVPDLIEFNIDGSFSKRYSNCFLIDQKYGLVNWHFVDDTLYLGVVDNMRGQEEFKALLVNKYGVVKNKFRNYDMLEFKGDRIFNGLPKLFEFNNSVFLKQQFNDTLFSLNKKYELVPQYIFNLGKYGVPKDVRTTFPPIINDYFYINDLFLTPNYLFLNVNFGKKIPSQVLGIYDKKSKETIFCKPTNSENPLPRTGIINDVDAGPMFFPIKIINDYTMAMVIEAKQLKDHVRSNDFKNNVPKYPDKKKQLEELANKLTEFDNPILILVTFKK